MTPPPPAANPQAEGERLRAAAYERLRCAGIAQSFLLWLETRGAQASAKDAGLFVRDWIIEQHPLAQETRERFIAEGMAALPTYANGLWDRATAPAPVPPPLADDAGAWERLREAAEAAEPSHDGQEIDLALTAFWRTATPAAVLALLAERARLEAENDWLRGHNQSMNGLLKSEPSQDTVEAMAKVVHFEWDRTAAADARAEQAEAALAAANERSSGQEKLLRRLYEWDVMDTGDGEYWKAEIARALSPARAEGEA